MKRCALIASLVLVPTAQAASMKLPSAHLYSHLYKQVVHKFNKRTPGRNILRDGLSSGKRLTNKDLAKSIVVLRHMLAPPVITTTQAPTYQTTTIQPTYSAPTTSGGGYANVPGVPSSFAACVAMRESTNGAGSSNIYGILGSGGQGSIAQQKAAFAQMYAQRGTQPWAPYDGC